MKKIALSLVIVVVLALAGCAPAVTPPAASEAAGAAEPGKLRIVTTVSPITNIAYNIAGDRAEIVGIVPEGVNSHTFEPAPSDARR
ncbi:MAG: zinc ABC transporter substrate-binding protein, partial [Caldilineaceae bacterium]|nr:zinc ABC transporter substrate-binding protein [Caldilineaceae bacterium]